MFLIRVIEGFKAELTERLAERTLIHLAAFNGWVDVLDAILTSFAPSDISTHWSVELLEGSIYYQTPFTIAVSQNEDSICEVIFRRLALNLKKEPACCSGFIPTYEEKSTYMEQSAGETLNL